MVLLIYLNNWKKKVGIFDYLEDLTVLCEPIKVNKKKGIEYIVYDWKDWFLY